MKLSKLRRYRVNRYIDPIHRVYLYVGYRVRKRDELVKKVFKKAPADMPDAPPSAAHIWQPSPETIFLEINEKFDISDPVRFQRFCEVCAHEGFHATQYLVQRIGQGYDTEHDEPFAYFAGWVATCMADTLLDFSGQRKK